MNQYAFFYQACWIYLGVNAETVMKINTSNR